MTLLIPWAELLFNNSSVSDGSEEVGCVPVCVLEKEKEREREGGRSDGRSVGEKREDNLIVA